jgi:hypothetical protein
MWIALRTYPHIHSPYDDDGDEQSFEERERRPIHLI